jgi:xanthine/CO dehydrogenase XdhC/CoxF family maturation factor
MLEPLPQRHAAVGVRLDTSLELLLAHLPAQGACALATVVATAGSTYRKPGARMLIRADGGLVGLLSGGCLESDLVLHAHQVIHSGQARAVEYDMRGPDDELFGIGAGCEGAMRVLLEPAHAGTSAAAALNLVAAAVRRGAPTSLIMVHESATLTLGTYHPSQQTTVRLPQGLLAAAAQSLAEGVERRVDRADGGSRERAFVQHLAPAPHLLICGAGPDAEPVVRSALGLGWRVTVVDHRPAHASPLRFPGATVHCVNPELLRQVVALQACHAAVVMSHHLKSDEAYLRELAAAGAPDYVGLLGPAARRQRIARDLGVAYEHLRSRLRGPVGIDIGAVNPESIALSIVSQLHAHLAGRKQLESLI